MYVFGPNAAGDWALVQSGAGANSFTTALLQQLNSAMSNPTNSAVYLVDTVALTVTRMR